MLLWPIQTKSILLILLKILKLLIRQLKLKTLESQKDIKDSLTNLKSIISVLILFRKMKGVLSEVIQQNPTTNLTDIPKNILAEVKEQLAKIDTFEFNIFEIDALIQKKSMFHVANYILNKYNFIEDLLNQQNYVSFINEIISGYNRKVPYHNDLHATDVLQTSYILLEKGQLAHVSK